MKSPRKLKPLGSKRRNTKGVSITELLVTAILLGVSLAAVAEVMSMCVLTNTKLTNQFDTQFAMSVGIDRLKHDVRTANEVVFTTPGDPSIPSTPPEFPGERSNAQTLILRLPITYLDKKNDPGSPDYVSSAPLNPLNGILLPGYDMVMYKVIPDPDRPNQYKMEISRKGPPKFKEDSTCSYRSEIFPAQTVLKGIIGPTEPGSPPGSPPSVFKYLCRFNGTSALTGVSALTSNASAIPNAISGCSGIGIDIEMRQNGDSAQSQQTAFDDVRGAHAEAFLRVPKLENGIPDPSLYELN